MKCNMLELKRKGRIGIFGGTFNPITRAHLQIAENVARKMLLDWFMFEPVNDKYNKNGLIDVEDRINMIQLCIFNINELNINGCSFDIGKVDANSLKMLYTYELLQQYKTMFYDTDLYFIMGSDNLEKFDTWKRPDKIFELANLVIIGRGETNIKETINSNSVLLKNVKKIHIIDDERLRLSSTMVRSWLNRDSDVPDRYLPSMVLEYIKKHKLYKN